MVKIDMKMNFHYEKPDIQLKELMQRVPLCISATGSTTEGYTVDEEEDW